MKKILFLFILFNFSFFIFKDNIFAVKKSFVEIKKVGINKKQDKNIVDKETKEEINLWVYYFRITISLLIIIFLIYLTIFFLKIFFSKKFPLKQNSTLINLIESHFLSPNKSIHIVEIAGKIFILGAGEKEIALIKEIKDEESLKRIKEKKSSVESKVLFLKPFREYLTKRSQEYSDRMRFEENLRILQEKIKELKNKEKNL